MWSVSCVEGEKGIGIQGEVGAGKKGSVMSGKKWLGWSGTGRHPRTVLLPATFQGRSTSATVAVLGLLGSIIRKRQRVSYRALCGRRELECEFGEER
eukprot:1361728-Rhodomonas_salina.1